MRDGRSGSGGGQGGASSGPRSKACRRDRPLFHDLISTEASSRRSSSMVIINVRTAGALPMVIADRARRSKRVDTSQFNLLFTISKKGRHF